MTLSRGSAGSTWFTATASGDVPTFKVAAVDTTGAGDGFMAGLIAGYLTEPDALTDPTRLHRLCRFANAVGALTTLQRGAIPALPTARRRRRFLAGVTAMTAQIIPVAVFDLVVFGATGDLSFRKLMPALYWRESDQQMPEGSRIIGVARSQLTTRRLCGPGRGGLPPARGRRLRRGRVRAPGAADHLRAARCGQARATGPTLAQALAGGEDRPACSTSPPRPTCSARSARAPVLPGIVTPQSRVVLEKPIGRDLASAIRINDEVGRVFRESQVYRIDHYLGKESVQNLLALRFANSLFESLSVGYPDAYERLLMDVVRRSDPRRVGGQGTSFRAPTLPVAGDHPTPPRLSPATAVPGTRTSPDRRLRP